jgi:hypothetical protein
MTGVVNPPTFSIWNSLIVSSFAACLLQSPAPAQTDNAASLLKQYQGEVARVREAAGKLGPYEISADCSSTCLKRYWFGACEETGAAWSASVDFGSTRSSLNSVLQEAERYAGEFSASFAPTQAWIDRLPEFSHQFNADADRVLGVQQDIKAGNDPTDQQRQVVAQALQSLTGILDSSSTQLRQGTNSLAAFLQRQSQYRQAIAQAIAGFDRSSQDQLNVLMQNVSNVPGCDTSTIRRSIEGQFDSIKGQFAISSREISQAFQNLETSSRAAERAVAELLGFVVSSQTDIGSVRDMVNAAKADQLGGFLQRLHLGAAKNRLAMLITGVR